MSKQDDEQAKLYYIPKNFIDKSTIFGGEIALRNAIEGGVLGAIIGFPIINLNFSLSTKIIILFATALPVLILGIVGVQGEPLTSFIINLFKFIGSRRIIGEKEELNDKHYKKSFGKELFRPTLNSKVLDKRKGKIFTKSLNNISSYIPISKIENGIIYTTDKRYIKVLEISPINFLLRSNKEQKRIVYQFVSFLKVAPVKFQIKVLSKKADIGEHLEKLQKDIDNETDEKCRALQEDYKKLIKSLGQKEAIVRQFFIIFEYDRFSNSYGNKSEEQDIIAELESVSNNIRSYLKSCGNDIISHSDENYFLMDLFYNILNREKASTFNLKSNIDDIVSKYMKNGWISELEHINQNEFIVPKNLDLSHSDFVKIDGLYHSYMIIPSEGYKEQVVAGWTSLLVNAGEGIDIDFYFQKQQKESIRTSIGRKIRNNKHHIKGTSDTNDSFEALADAIGSGYYLKNGISNGEDFYYVNIVVTITGYTLKELKWRINEMKKLLTSQDLQIFPINFRMEQGFLSALPLLNIDKYLYNRGRRNVLSTGVASFYPFTSYQISDANGIMLGTNKHNNSMVIVDIFNAEVYKNANLAILGTSGAGKTFLLQLMALRFRRKNTQVFIVAPLKAHEFYRACSNINGEFIQISPASKNCINILDIRKADTVSSELIDDYVVEKSLLASRVQRLHIFFSLLIPDLNHEEKQLLDEALIITYNRKGITHDNDSLLDENDNTKFREMPILEDVYNVLLEKAETKRMANILARLVKGSAKSFSQQTNVNLDNKYTVLDISELSGDLLTVGMFVALDFCWDKSKEDRTKEKAIFIDEAWALIGANSNKLAAEFVLEIFKIIRGYGGSAICATQDINDFFALDDGKYGKGIINNSKIKITLGLEENEAETVQRILNLSEREATALTTFERGTGLISANSNKVEVSFKASDFETELITTDREQLKLIAQKKALEKNKMGEI